MGRVARVSPGALVAAGGVWSLAWVHMLLAHGRTTNNEMNVVLGMTWMDSSKFLVLSFVLLGVALVGLSSQRAENGLAWKAALIVTYASLAVVTAGVVLGFWTMPWGSYAVSRSSGLPAVGGALTSLGSLVLVLGLVPVAIGLRRAGVMSWWAVVVLAVGAFSAVPWLHETYPQGVLFGLAMVLVGLASLRNSADVAARKAHG